MMIARLTIVGAATALAMVTGAGAATALDRSHDLPEVELSFANRDIVFTDATHWTIPLHSQGGSCQGTYLVPEITAGPGAGTSVRYGVKYFCTQAVEYTIYIGMDELDSTNKATARRWRVDQGSGRGVSQNPYLARNTPLCRSNRNHGWLPYDTTNIMGQTKTKEAQTVTTVGCTINL